MCIVVFLRNRQESLSEAQSQLARSEAELNTRLETAETLEKEARESARQEAALRAEVSNVGGARERAPGGLPQSWGLD